MEPAEDLARAPAQFQLFNSGIKRNPHTEILRSGEISGKSEEGTEREETGKALEYG
jgi:hypothetical protein